ncbi:MAG: SRPBCC family protein [Ferruginibacter sp.]
MTKIHLTTFINAPADRVFDLSRSINLHKISLSETRAEAIAGITSGLINLDETVTWQAKHLYKIRQFTSRIKEMKLHDYFIDEMIKGDFKSFRHEHHFKMINNGTIMIDLVEFESPYGFIGRIFNQLYMGNYIEKFILKRNDVIKKYAETEKWRAILN